MVKIKAAVFTLLFTFIGIEAMSESSESIVDQVYRLPVYPSKPTNMTVGCFSVSTDPAYAEYEYPLNVLQFLLHETQREEIYDVGPNFNRLPYFSESYSVAFTKAVAYSRIYQMYSEFLYWLDNVYSLSQSALHRVESQFFQFDRDAFDHIFLKGSFISIYHWSQSNEADIERLSLFLESFPGILYISSKNDTVLNLDKATMQTLQSDKIANIFNLFEDSVHISNQNPLVQEFVVDLQELLLEIEKLFIENPQIDYPSNPPYSLEQEWQSNLWLFHRKSSSYGDYQTFYSPDFTICGVESQWQLPGLLEKVLSTALEEIYMSAVNLASFVKYELETRVVSDGTTEQCIQVNCWRRDQSTLMALPSPNIDDAISQKCFSVYFAVGTLTPNLRIGAPTWIDWYLEESAHDATVDGIGYQSVNTLSNLHKVYEKALNFVTFIHNLKGYVENVLAEAPLQPQIKIPHNSFYSDFMEMGYYILQRNVLDFPDEIVNRLAINLFQSYVNITYTVITDDPSSSHFPGTVDVDSIRNSLLSEIDRMVKEYMDGLGTEVKVTELNTYNYPEFRTVYDKVKETSESLEYYEELFSTEKWTYENNDIRTICAGSGWRRGVSSDGDTNSEAILNEFSEHLRDAAFTVSTTVATNIRNLLQHKRSSGQCTGLICDIIFSSYFPLFEPLTTTISQPCVSPWFVGWLKEPVFRGYIPASVLELLTSLTHTELFSFFGSAVGADPLGIIQEQQVQLLKVNVYQIIFSLLGQYSMWVEHMKSMDQRSLDNVHFTEGLKMTDTYFQRLDQFREKFSYVGYQGLILLNNDRLQETELTHDDFLLNVGIQMFQDMFGVEKTPGVTSEGTDVLSERFRLNIQEIFSVKEDAIDISDTTVIGRLVKNVTSSVEEILEGRLINKFADDIYDFQEYVDNGIYRISVCGRNASSFNERKRGIFDTIDEHLQQFNYALLGLAVELYEDIVIEVVTIPQSLDTNTRNANMHGDVKRVTESGAREDKKDDDDRKESTTATNDVEGAREDKKDDDDRKESTTATNDEEDDGTNNEEDLHTRTVTEDSNKDDETNNGEGINNQSVTEKSNEDDETKNVEDLDNPTVTEKSDDETNHGEEVDNPSVTEKSNEDEETKEDENVDNPAVTEKSDEDEGEKNREDVNNPEVTEKSNEDTDGDNADNPSVTEDANEGGRNNRDQTESTPEDNEQVQYRASYVPSQGQALLLNGEAKEFDLYINAVGTGFAGVIEEDVTITMHDLRSFRNEATVTMTVRRLTARSIIAGVSADASASWSFTMAIKDQPILNAQSADPLKVDFKVEHSAPTCNDHRFTNSGNAIKFEFNVPVHVSRTREGGCRDFFEDVSNLGDGATCDMKTPRLLVVTIGKGSNLIEPGDVLVFKPNTVSPARQMFYQSMPIEEFSIDPPHSPQGLSFTIDGPTRINRCGNYQLRAEQIAGHGGRPVTYRWQPHVAANSGAIQELELYIIQNGLNEGRGTAVLPIDATDLTPGEQYAFSLEITNFLGQVHTEYHALIVLNNVNPVVQIKPINVIPGRVRASSRIKLEAVVTYSFGDGCQSNENVATYAWSDSEGLIPSHLKDDRILVLPPNTLPVDETIQLTVTVTSVLESNTFAIVTPVTVRESITLTTIATPLVAEIGGASKLTLGPDETIELDGSRSNDPDEMGSQDLSYQWDCFSMSREESCINSLGNQLNTPKLSLQASDFQAGSYSISLTVSRGHRSATASVTVIIVEDSVPMIKLKTRSGKIKFRDEESIYIQANIASSSAVTVTWRESNDRLDSEIWEKAEMIQVRNKAEYRTHVKIPADQSTPGYEYTIEVIATNQNGKSGVAAFDISVYQTITQCEVNATPYTEMQEMTLTATGCVTDPDSEPLTYQPFFALPVEDGYKTIILDGSKGESSQAVIATPIDYNNENVLVGFKVCDASLACIDVLTTTLYQPTGVLSDTERDLFIKEKIDNELDRGNVAKAFSNAINIANMQKKSLSAQVQRKKRNIVDEFGFLYTDDLNSVLLVVDRLDLSIGNTARTQFNELGKKQAKVLSKVVPVDSDEGAVILDLSSQMVQSTFNEGEIDTTLNAVDRIFKKAREEGFRHSSETMERALTTLGSSARNLKETSSKEKRTKQMKKISDLRKAALTQAGHDFSIGDHVTFNVSGTKMAVICFLPEGDTPIDESVDIPVKIHPGGSLSQRYLYDWCADGDEACSGVKALVMQVQDLQEETAKCSDLTDITLLNPVTDWLKRTDTTHDLSQRAEKPEGTFDEEQSIQDLEDPVEIEMTTMQVGDGQSCVCKYWNEETAQLESDGVTSETTTDGKLVCKSSHLTTFVGELIIHLDSSTDPSATQGLPKTPQDSQLALILGIVFGVLLLIVVVFLVGAIMFKVTQKKKVAPDSE